MSNFEYNCRLTSITEIQGAALVLNTPPHQALSVDDMRLMFPEASIPEAPRNGTLIHTEDYSMPKISGAQAGNLTSINQQGNNHA